ncbi:unnamed protein product [Blumeria hordei]|uniref:Protein kinase domain-containing protein n=1 Tax=Blumeria hordei TaxID=2867405 RepID=A0A383UZR3_BLUHO|nr:unnamed protein product [Blumeria hordei]
MSLASPTPMSNSYFASQPYHQVNRSTHEYKYPKTRPIGSRGLSPKPYSLGDSSDDEIPVPIFKCSALTNALLDGGYAGTDKSAPEHKRATPELVKEIAQVNGGSVDLVDERPSPSIIREPNCYPKRKVRLSRTPGSSVIQRSKSVSIAAQPNDVIGAKCSEGPTGWPLDLSTPAPAPKRTVRLPVSSGRRSDRENSASQPEEGEIGFVENPSTITRQNPAGNQASQLNNGLSTIGRTRYGEDAGVKKVAGAFMSIRPRRGRRRISDENHSPAEEIDMPLSLKSENLEVNQPEKQAPNEPQIQELQTNYRPTLKSRYRSGSPLSANEPLPSIIRRSKSPSPELIPCSRPASLQQAVSQLPAQPIYNIPSLRPILPSKQNQENEAPPTFKRKQPVSLIHLSKMEEVQAQVDGLKLQANRVDSPIRRQPLAPRSENTPRRPAPPPPKMTLLETATSTAGAATTSNASSKRNRLKINGKAFTRLDCIGRGGSSRVYRVMAENSKFFALKKVSLENADESAVQGFKGEIDLLRKLESVERVIRLYDYELNEDKGVLTVLMEMGELDLNKILEVRLKSENAKFDPSFVRHYWKEMLECLQAIHDHDIVHSDLKPHNFVLVQGRLKLIDFGIANAIQTDETVNVHRDTQIGTPNYMSPESLIDSNAKSDVRGYIANAPKLMKLGKPSDIWSLGCILYQMTYGRAPFSHIQNQMQRCHAIIDHKYAIEYPALGVGNISIPNSLVHTLKRCLNRDQHQRPSALELLQLSDPFLYPTELEVGVVPMTEELLGRILLNVGAKFKNKTPTDAELLKVWPQGYFDRLRKNMAEGRAL